MEAIDRAATKFGMPMGPMHPDRPGRPGYGRLCRQGGRQGLPDRTVTSPILEEMLKASPGDKKSLMKFWLSDKKSKPQPNPAALAIIAKHRNRRARDRPGGDHRPALLADAAGGDARAGRGDRPRAGGRRYGPDPGHRVSPRSAAGSSAGATVLAPARSSRSWRSMRTLASDSSRPSRCFGWRKRARRFIRAPSWLQALEIRHLTAGGFFR